MINKLTVYYLESTLAFPDFGKKIPTFSFPMDAHRVEENFKKLSLKDKKRVLQTVSSMLGMNDRPLSIEQNHGPIVEAPRGIWAEDGAHKPLYWKIPELSGGTIQAIGVCTALMKTTNLVLRFPEVNIHHKSVQAMGLYLSKITKTEKNIHIVTRCEHLIEGIDRAYTSAWQIAEKELYNENLREAELYYMHGNYCKKMKIREFDKEHNRIKRLQEYNNERYKNYTVV